MPEESRGVAEAGTVGACERSSEAILRNSKDCTETAHHLVGHMHKAGKHVAKSHMSEFHFAVIAGPVIVAVAWAAVRHTETVHLEEIQRVGMEMEAASAPAATSNTT